MTDVFLCPVPSDANPADVRLRVPALGCTGAAIFVPSTPAALQAIALWTRIEMPGQPRRSFIATIIPPPPVGGAYVILLYGD